MGGGGDGWNGTEEEGAKRVERKRVERAAGDMKSVRVAMGGIP